MSITGPPLAISSGSHSAIKLRQMLLSMFPVAGVAQPGDCLVKQRVSPGQGLLVSAGGMFMKGSTSSVQGVYFDYNDADLDVPASTSDGSQTRIDRVIYRVRDPDFQPGTPPGTFEWLTGTAGSGVPPTPPADSVSVAQIARAIGSPGNTLVNANITDERVFLWRQLATGTSGFAVMDSTGTKKGISIADTGGVTLRGPLSIPSSIDGTVAASNYGSVMQKIDEVIVGAAAASVTFSSIVQGFRHLLVKVQARGDNASAGTMNITVNGQTGGASYLWQQIYGNSNTPLSTGSGNTGPVPVASLMPSTADAGMATQVDMAFTNYARTVFRKTWIANASYFSTAGAANEFISESSGILLSTAAITSISFAPTVGNFVTDSVFTLYGLP